ncbi:MAG: thiol peroxidase [Spirochaetales bacterium]|nr:thiol peroxidase [Spirochaetales bacterium]
MAQVTLQGNPIDTVGSLPVVGAEAKSFTLVAKDMSPLSLGDFKGKNVVLNIFPSLDTETCAASVRRFNKEASSLDDTVVLCISADLPFAAGRFCTTEGLEDVHTGSTFRNRELGQDYGVAFVENTPMAGLLSRSVVIVGKDGKVMYNQQVQEITDEPDYDSALAALKS